MGHGLLRMLDGKGQTYDGLILIPTKHDLHCCRFPLPFHLHIETISANTQVTARKTAQLENRLNNLIEKLEAGGGESSIAHSSRPSSQSHRPPHRAIRSIAITNTTSPPSHTARSPYTEPSLGDQADVPQNGPTSIPNTYNYHGPIGCVCRPLPGVAQGPLDSDEALLRVYREELMPGYPFVIVSKDTTAQDLQATRPFLMACIRMVASIRNTRSTQGQMYQLMSYVSDHMLIRSERSMDLLAGIVVMISWHNYHCLLHGQLQNLISLAMTLVAELGLKRPSGWQERTRLMVMNLTTAKERTNEERRLLLAVWHLSSCVSIGLQQLDPMRYSTYIQQCMSELEEADELESDAYLVQLVKIQHLSEKIACLDGRYDVDTESERIDKAPISGYILAFEAELEMIHKTMPRRLKTNGLLQLQRNTVRIRLNEPPRVDASLLASLATSMTTSAPTPNTSPLDGFYRSHAALKQWFDDFLASPPPSSYYCLPLPFSMIIIYAVVILGRWAKLCGPGPGSQPLATPEPSDPSGSYNNPMLAPLTPASSTLNDSTSSRGEYKLVSALARLKLQLTTQPGLSLDVNGILGMLCDRLERVGAFLAGHDTASEARVPNIWMLKAAKLRIVQFKLQQWADLVERGDENEEEDSDNSEYHNEIVETGRGVGKYGEMPDPESHTMSSPDNQLEEAAVAMADRLAGMDSFMYPDDWANWGFSFDFNIENLL
ncbi:hypothetical protein N7493_002903 [Penicillium malachiteum]|uniref:Transcription factor domain-containing protein n=1 Tax=Penicillium malachiteum TaxID=1324776 RepID=A0AAD6HTG6_9EURO|nr:hypothetical protein N7493_002903 [Penicillium malachiteum]